MPKQKGKVGVFIWLDADIKKKIDEIAERNNITVSTFIRLCILEKLAELNYLDKRYKKALIIIESLTRQARKSQEVCENGND